MTILIVIAAIVIAAVMMYNGMISARNRVDNAYAQIDVMLKKRFDLIPNLVATVQQYAEHEMNVLTKIVEMRNRSYSEMTQDEKVAMDGEVRQAMRSINVIAENYPDLKASANFEQLQRSLNETEEQISAARRTYNAAVTDYNTTIESFPNNLVAKRFGHSARQLLETPVAERENVSVKDLFKK